MPTQAVVLKLPPKVPESHKVLTFMESPPKAVPRGRAVRYFDKEAVAPLNKPLGSNETRLLVAYALPDWDWQRVGVKIDVKGRGDVALVALVETDGSIVLYDILPTVRGVLGHLPYFEAAELVSSREGLPIADATVIPKLEELLHMHQMATQSRVPQANIIFRSGNGQSLLTPGEQFREGYAVLVDDLRAAVTEAQRDS